MSDNTNTNANFKVGAVGVPGAQVELMGNMQPPAPPTPPAADYALQSQQQPSMVQQQQQQQQQHVPRDPRQFDQQYQQSFFTQPNDIPVASSSAATATSLAAPGIVPANTNAVGDGSPGFSVGGVGVPGAQVELIDSMRPQSYQQQQPLHEQLIQRQHVQQQHVQQRHVQQQYVQQLQSPIAPADAPVQQSFFTQPGDLSSIQRQQQYTPHDIQQQQTKPLELDSVQHASASREPVGPFDPAEPPVPPTIFLQREASMRHDQETPATTTTTTTNSTSTPIGVASAFTGGAPQVAPHKVHVASSGAVAAAAAAQAADASTLGRRRSSRAVLADKIRSSTSRSRSPSLSRRLSRTIPRHSFEDEDDNAGGPYKDVRIAQQEHLVKLRSQQERDGITHNVDGLPIPSPPERQRRRSSASHILGLDKPLLSR
ncbi:hypothetical protein BGX29_002380 [Mortierella sp. GBA35]|nr:hypothetical protein BGX29_002380 [Mortierella sp. GBA35]